MKKTLLLLILFWAQNLLAQEWKFVEKGIDGTEYFYKPNTSTTAWTKDISAETIYFEGSKRKKVDGYHLSLWQFDCDKRKIGIVQKHTYNTSGENLESTSLKDYEVEMNYVIPDSIGENLLNSFCQK